MKAMILAAGRGKRMMPLTKNTPKTQSKPAETSSDGPAPPIQHTQSEVERIALHRWLLSAEAQSGAARGALKGMMFARCSCMFTVNVCDLV